MDAKNKQLELSNLALKQCQDNNANLTSQVEKLTEEKNSVLRNPFVMGLFGIVIGVTLAKTVLK